MRLVAFLRAINVGGHVVKMDKLQRLFEDMGFAGVETFIASGNVIFEAKSRSRETMATRIAEELHRALGYETPTFLRSLAELEAIANYEPFSQDQIATAVATNVALLGKPLDRKALGRVMALQTGLDDFHINGTEIHWLSRARQSESVISNVVIEKATGQPSTVRGINTIRRMAAKYRP